MTKTAMLPPSMRRLTQRILTRPRTEPVGQRRSQREPAAVPPLRPSVDIPVCSPEPDATAIHDHRARGRYMARQDRWEQLCHEIVTADHARMLTPGLYPVAPILAAGARADVISAARDAIASGDARAAQAAVKSLEYNLEDLPACPGLSAVLALAHLDLARAFSAGKPLDELSPERVALHDRHVATASALADRFDPFELDMPLWAMIRCALLNSDPDPGERAADDYEDLIDLDPVTPEHMIALGRDLHPKRFGSWDMLDLQARRTAARTADIWGLGAYAWVWIGALSHHAVAVQQLDVELFAEALHEIMDRHRDNQHMANRLAAFTGLTVHQDALDDAPFTRMTQSFNWIVQDHLRELHPLVWAKAATPGRTRSPEIEAANAAQRGKARALSVIAQRLGAEMGSARRIRLHKDAPTPS